MTRVEGSPERLLVAARVLHESAAGLRRESRRLQDSSTLVGTGWQGTASLRCAARVRQSGAALERQGAELDATASATQAYAGRLASAQQEVAALERRRGEVMEEVSRMEGVRLLAPAVPTPPVEALLDARRRLQALTDRQRAVREELDLAGEALARALLAHDPTVFVPLWALGAYHCAHGAASGRQVLTKGRAVLSMARNLTRARQTVRGAHGGDYGTWTRFLQAADEDLAVFRDGRSGRLARLAPRAARVAGRYAFLASTAVEGGVDAVTGGGYDDWRNPVSRVLGGAGAAGALTLVVVGSGGTVALVAAGAVVAYTAWRLGNDVWDHRAEIADFTRRSWRSAVALERRARGWATDRAKGAATELRSQVSHVAGRIRSVAGRVHLPTLSLPHLGLWSGAS